jgi:hypothetical protein
MDRYVPRGHHSGHHGHGDRRHIQVHGHTLVCHRTPAGSWICCSDDETKDHLKRCARGFTVESAAAAWERAEALAD